MITAAMVAELREITDAPMMECKKALYMTNGDMLKAVEVLRLGRHKASDAILLIEIFQRLHNLEELVVHQSKRIAHLEQLNGVLGK
jgi:hypothetical protein